MPRPHSDDDEDDSPRPLLPPPSSDFPKFYSNADFAIPEFATASGRSAIRFYTEFNLNFDANPSQESPSGFNETEIARKIDVLRRRGLGDGIGMGGNESCTAHDESTADSISYGSEAMAVLLNSERSGDEGPEGSVKKKLKRGMDFSNSDEPLPNCIDGMTLNFGFETQNITNHTVQTDGRQSDSDGGDRSGIGIVSGNSDKNIITANVDEEGPSRDGNGNDGIRRFSAEEKGKEILIFGDNSPDDFLETGLELVSEPMNWSYNNISNLNLLADIVASQEQEQEQEQERERVKKVKPTWSDYHLKLLRESFRDSAVRFAKNIAKEEAVNRASLEAEVEIEIHNLPGPFSTALKKIRDRDSKMRRAGWTSSESLLSSISWVPRRDCEQKGARDSVPSLQQLTVDVLANNADAIVSLDYVPDTLRHKLCHLLCDSRKMNSHILELLVRGSPTQIRLRDCSWLTDEQFTKSFQLVDTTELRVLQLDQCGRCMTDYVIPATLARSPKQLHRLISLSLSGACGLSDRGLSILVSSAPELRSINLSQCSLLTSASLNVLADSLGSVLKELYLEDCIGIDAALIVPALQKLEYLQVLSVAGIQNVCDEFIKNLVIARGHNLKELVLKNCEELTDSSIKFIAELCPGLCSLDLTNLCKLTDSSIGYLANGCRELHILKLLGNPFSDEAIAAFMETAGGCLEELSLNKVKKVGYHTTMSLAKHAKNLHTLDLSWCRNLIDEALGLIVDSCLSLRLLKLFGCSQITEVFLCGHSNRMIKIIGCKKSPLLQHVKMLDHGQGA